MRVGLIYDIFSDYPWTPNDPPDADAEFEPLATVEVLEEALRLLGHVPVRVGSPHTLLREAGQIHVEAAVNIAEGVKGRNREAYAPILLEMLGVPYVGSDALTLSLSLDKAWTKDLVEKRGVLTPSYRVYRTAEEVDEHTLPAPFPLFVKPRYEGSAKSIVPQSKVRTGEALVGQVGRICGDYGQDALVEAFIEGGGEFTIAIVGHDPPRTMPALQRAVERETRIGLHALDRRGFENPSLAYDLGGSLSPELEDEMARIALDVFEILECKDFGRVDFRVDERNVPWFLEINPLPTFAPDGTFAILAELTGVSYVDLLADTLRQSFDRLGLVP